MIKKKYLTSGAKLALSQSRLPILLAKYFYSVEIEGEKSLKLLDEKELRLPALARVFKMDEGSNLLACLSLLLVSIHIQLLEKVYFKINVLISYFSGLFFQHVFMYETFVLVQNRQSVINLFVHVPDFLSSKLVSYL